MKGWENFWGSHRAIREFWLTMDFEFRALSHRNFDSSLVSSQFCWNYTPLILKSGV
jgi:hypothetical protein